VRKLENLLKGEWPNETFSVHAFGSTENHLGTDTSDLDVCIVTSEQSLAKRICRLAMFMHDCKLPPHMKALLILAGMKNVVCRAGAKVPVVAVFDPELYVRCCTENSSNQTVKWHVT
jgi:DNA polymerase sigma